MEKYRENPRFCWLERQLMTLTPQAEAIWREIAQSFPPPDGMMWALTAIGSLMLIPKYGE